MKSSMLLAATALLASTAVAAPTRPAKPHVTKPTKAEAAKAADTRRQPEAFFHPSEVRSTGSVTVGGQPIPFEAIAGTIVIHAKDW